MSEQDLDRLYTERHEAVMEGIRGINERLDKLNGRTRQNEQDIAVLKDRGTRQGLLFGTGGSIVSAAVIYALNWFSRPH